MLKFAVVLILSSLASVAQSQPSQNVYYLAAKANGQSLLSCGPALSNDGVISTKCTNLKTMTAPQFSAFSKQVKKLNKNRKIGTAAVIGVGLTAAGATALVSCPAFIVGGAELGGATGAGVGAFAGGVGAVPGSILGGLGGATVGLGGCMLLSTVAGTVAAFTTDIVITHTLTSIEPGTLAILVDGEQMGLNKLYRLEDPKMNPDSKQFIKLFLAHK